MDGPGGYSQPGFSLTDEKISLIHQRLSDALIFNNSYAAKDQLPTEIVWSTNHLNPRQIVASGCHHLPAILCVETGFFGGGNIDCVASGQVAVVQGIYRQRRVVAVPLREQGRHFSLPLLGCHHKFIQLGAPLSDASATKSSTLDVLLKAKKLPIAVKFADNKLHQNYGDFTLVKQYDELYLYGHNIADGCICLPMTVIPVYLDITLSIGEGVVNGNANDWLLLKDTYIQESQRLLKDVIIRGYMDMASFDSTWQQRDTSERPTSAVVSTSVINEEKGSDSDGDERYSYVKPSKYIKIVVDLSLEDYPALDVNEMFEVEGPRGILSLMLSSASRLAKSNLSAKGLSPDICSCSDSYGDISTLEPISAGPRSLALPGRDHAKPSGAGFSSGSVTLSPASNCCDHTVPTTDRGRREEGSRSVGRAAAASDKPHKPLPALPLSKPTHLPTVKAVPEAMATVHSHSGASHAELDPLPAANSSHHSKTPPLLAPRLRQPSNNASNPSSHQIKPSSFSSSTKQPSGKSFVPGGTIVASGNSVVGAVDISAQRPVANVAAATQAIGAALTQLQPQLQQLAVGQRHAAAAAASPGKSAQTAAVVKGSASVAGPTGSEDDSDHSGYEEIDDVEDIAQAHLTNSRFRPSPVVSKAPSAVSHAPNVTGRCTDPRPSVAAAAAAAEPKASGLQPSAAPDSSTQVVAATQCSSSITGSTGRLDDLASGRLAAEPAPMHRSLSSLVQPAIEAGHGQESRREAVRVSGRSLSEGGSYGGMGQQQMATGSSSSAAPSDESFPAKLSDVPAGDLSALTNEQLCRCLRLLGMERCADAFDQDGMIDGVLLMEMEASDLCGHFGFTEFEAKKIVMFAHGWRPRQK